MAAVQKVFDKSLILPLAGVAINLIYFSNTADPLNPPKFWLLGLFSIYFLYRISKEKETLKNLFSLKPFKLFGVIIIILILSFTVAFVFTDLKSNGLIGFTGRNNGYLNYLFLIIVILYAALNFRLSNLHKFYISILVISLLFTTYGFFQHFNIDFIKWNTPYNKIVLTVGNPDFAAALLGLFISFLFALMIVTSARVKKLLLLGSILFSVSVIYWSKARQGLVATAIGIGLICFAWLWQKNKKAGISLLGLELLFGFVAVLGMLQVGPLTKYFYKASINDRGYNWRAAWHMFKSHPWLGVGLDRYAGYFAQYKDSKYPLIYGYTQTVNNSHNVFLQLLATGGIFVGISYVALIIFIGLRALIAWQKYKGSQQILVSGLISGWVIFVAQSIISIDNLTLSIWGWILGGAVIGLSLPENNLEGLQANSRSSGRAKFANRKENNLIPLSVLLVSIIAFIPVIFNMYQAESRYRIFQQIRFSNDQAGKNALYQYGLKTFNTPLQNSDYKIYIAVTVTNAGLVDEGIKLFKEILRNDPRRYDVYQFLATIYEQQKNYPLAIQNRLAAEKINPYGADSLLELVKDYKSINDVESMKRVIKSLENMAPNSELTKTAQNLNS